MKNHHGTNPIEGQAETQSAVIFDKKIWARSAPSGEAGAGFGVTYGESGTEGQNIGLRLSDLAVAWGEPTAYSWRFDGNFQRHLGSGVLFG